jgi:hypothetical protein
MALVEGKIRICDHGEKCSTPYLASCKRCKEDFCSKHIRFIVQGPLFATPTSAVEPSKDTICVNCTREILV